VPVTPVPALSFTEGSGDQRGAATRAREITSVHADGRPHNGIIVRRLRLRNAHASSSSHARTKLAGIIVMLARSRPVERDQLRNDAIQMMERFFE
jgi:hypothetical protein